MGVIDFVIYLISVTKIFYINFIKFYVTYFKTLFWMY